MSSQKDDAEDAAARWQMAAHANNYRCIVCGAIPPYEERDTYFEKGLCEWCRNQAEKDD